MRRQYSIATRRRGRGPSEQRGQPMAPERKVAGETTQ